MKDSVSWIELPNTNVVLFYMSIFLLKASQDTWQKVVSHRLRTTDLDYRATNEICGMRRSWPIVNYYSDEYHNLGYDAV
jgi:hypothetical protein